MGLTISWNESEPIPRATTLTLVCDAEVGLMFSPARAVFRLPGFVENYSAAMRAGWLERHGPQGRTFLCPDCSGKKSPTAAASF